MEDSNIKEYYIRLNNLYENAVNILTALNQSLSSSASQVSVTTTDNNGETSILKIPSFLYLENKLEQLDLNFTNLFKLPESGEAVMYKDGTTYKLDLIKSNKAPQTPSLGNSVIASFVDNNILKDMVSPKMFLQMDVNNLSSQLNVDGMYFSKFIVYDSTLFMSLQNLLGTSPSYEELVNSLSNYTKGVDYDCYENTVDLPLKREQYSSAFNVLSVSSDSTETVFTCVLDTLTYTDKDNSAKVFTLKTSDYLTLNGSHTSTIYQINSIDSTTNTVELECYEGYENLVTTTTTKTLQVYKENTFSEYNYVQIPLEENPYIVLFVATVYNNIRSEFSTGKFINLNTQYVTDAYGNNIQDSNGNNVTYMSYYEKYCTNIGDLILGLTESAYPQVSNFTLGELKTLISDDTIQQAVTNTIEGESTLQVVAINRHLVDDTTNEDLINLHAQKNDLNSQLSSVQENIDSVYNTLVSTDFSQNTTTTQLDLQSKLQQYYTERTSLQSQIISVVENINTKTQNTDVNDEAKYRIRGITDVSALEDVVKTDSSSKVDIVGMDLEYKYKSTTKDTTTTTSINSNIFTDWNKLYNIDRQRELDIDTTNNSFTFEFTDYSSTQNIVKWNQIDIPIQQGEDVVLRVRYKYNIGQPFINLYTPWSDEFTVTFPDEYKNNVEITDIISQNQEDSISARFNKTLINEGYSEHNNNKLLSGDQVFYHMPENIYSGFTTSENNLISLKDKLLSMMATLNELETDVNSVLNQSFKVYITYDNLKVEINPNTLNTLTMTDDNNISSSFIKKNMNIVIENTGNTALNLYSIFPGNQAYPLLLVDNKYYNNYIGNYQSVPLIIDGKATPQTLGQWIYFRSTNPFTTESIYTVNRATSWSLNPSSYMSKDFSQPAFTYRDRTSADLKDVRYTYWNGIYKYRRSNSDEGILKILKGNSQNTINILDWDELTLEDITYKNASNGKFINRFEDIFYYDENNTKISLSYNTNIQEFANSYTYIKDGDNCYDFTNIDNYVGAFVFPNLQTKSQITTKSSEVNDYESIESGSSISLPICFEYYLNNSQVSSVTKGLYFDIKTSLFSDARHYVVEIVGNNSGSYDNYDYSQIGDSLSDDASNMN